eukprot:TRINITY_DN742_c0_g3_i2.p1 TRINITY_DN742_c0_g3~~TRINITY_DN742_c0_g3_i2.p1  ORF type:complete len:408 (-),score=65.49 TRINITY_DN742_c0_g3_i2:717-1940(-)
MWTQSINVHLSPKDLIGKRIWVQNSEEECSVDDALIGTISDGCPERDSYSVTLEKGGEVIKVQLKEVKCWWLWGEELEGEEANSKTSSNEKNSQQKSHNLTENGNGEVAQQDVQVKEEMEEVSAVGSGTEKPECGEQFPFQQLIMLLNQYRSFNNQSQTNNFMCPQVDRVVPSVLNGGGNDNSGVSVSWEMGFGHTQYNESPYKKRVLNGVSHTLNNVNNNNNNNNGINNAGSNLISYLNDNLQMLERLSEKDECSIERNQNFIGGCEGGISSGAFIPLLRSLSHQCKMQEGSSDDRVDQLDSIVNQLKEASSNKVVGECLAHIQKLEQECDDLVTTCKELEERCRIMEQRMIHMQTDHKKDLDGLELRLQQYRSCLSCVQNQHLSAHRTVGEAEWCLKELRKFYQG